jgi:hypothetical protein
MRWEILEKNCTIIFEFANGRKGSLDARWGQSHRRRPVAVAAAMDLLRATTRFTRDRSAAWKSKNQTIMRSQICLRQWGTDGNCNNGN